MQRTGSATLMILALVLGVLGLAGCGAPSTDRDGASGTASTGPSPTPPPEPDPEPDADPVADPVALEDFPLDQGWEETYGPTAVTGPGSGAGGISMPEGHCDDEVLFASGYRDKLSTYVTDDTGSRTREILRYADVGAARSTFRSLGDAVTGCPVYPDAYTSTVTYSAEVFDAIDDANARTGIRTLTFAYTSAGSEPFGVLYQFAVVGDLLYGSNVYGPWTEESAGDGVVSLDRDNDALVPLVSRIVR